jgi:hypothetical protein
MNSAQHDSLGVRPSSGAAINKPRAASGSSSTQPDARVPAPEDGRTPAAIAGALRILANLLIAAGISAGAADNDAGRHAAAGKEVEQQGEKDWSDSRWNQTDVGPFLASSLQTPGGMVVKALSVRVGSGGEASVCYDLAKPSLRAGWTGGFLKFSSVRFGIMGPPARAGEWAFSAAASAGWQGASARHETLRVQGNRIVLETRVDGTLVRETPWFERAGAADVFTRSFEVGAGNTELRHRVFASTNAVTETTRDGWKLLTSEQGARAITVAAAGESAKLLSANDGHIDVTFPPRAQPRRARLLIWSAKAGQTSSLFPPGADLNTLIMPEDVAALCRPGAAHWLPALTNAGQTGFPTDGFAVDTITVPYANPWKALFFCSGVDFFNDGSAAVSTIHGEVWRVRGLDDKLRRVTWKRFATGLYQPLGLRVVNDRAHVLGRDQITILHDENGDDEADRYENFSQLIKTSAGGHDYATCLERDAAGNFYFIDPKGVHRLSADGQKMDTLATGFRNPNGLGVGPGPVITATPQQGEWTPSSAIMEIKAGGYYGYGGPKVADDRPLGYDPPLCWLPHAFDNSSSSQVWVPADKWGALGGQMLHFAWGRCAMRLVLRDAAESPAQGAAVALPVKFLSGPMRGTFNPHDGHLYVAGSTGWQTSAARDGSLQRVRYTGAPPRVPIAWRAHENGLVLTFARPLAPDAADAGRFAVHQWNYRYAKQYGSKDYSVKQPDQEGRDEVEVRSAKLLPDGRGVFIEVPGLRPVMQMEVKYNLPFADGATASGPLYLTLNRLAAPLQPGSKSQ